MDKFLNRIELSRDIEISRREFAKGKGIPQDVVFNRDHALSGDLEGLRDCHIENDWVLFYFYTTTGELILTLSDTGTHSDLF